MNEYIRDLATDSLEIAVDTLLTEGIVKDIPIIGSLVKLALAGSTISDRIILKKLERFLFHYNLITDKDKGKLWARLNNDETKTKIGEHLVLLIDRYNNLSKPKILAMVFSAYVKEQIDLEKFLRLGNAIDFAYEADLKLLTKSQNLIDQQLLSNLLTSGLSKQILLPHLVKGGNPSIYLELSPLGEKFLELTKAEAGT